MVFFFMTLRRPRRRPRLVDGAGGREASTDPAVRGRSTGDSSREVVVAGGGAAAGSSSVRIVSKTANYFLV